MSRYHMKFLLMCIRAQQYAVSLIIFGLDKYKNSVRIQVRTFRKRLISPVITPFCNYTFAPYFIRLFLCMLQINKKYSSHAEEPVRENETKWTRNGREEFERTFWVIIRCDKIAAIRTQSFIYCGKETNESNRSIIYLLTVKTVFITLFWKKTCQSPFSLINKANQSTDHNTHHHKFNKTSAVY